MEFVHEGQAQRVVFGAGAIGKLGAELRALHIGRAVVLTTPDREATARTLVDAAEVGGFFGGARVHVPIANVEAALADAAVAGADGYVAFGGGSAVGLAKALARQTKLPIVAIPTTYAGSEITRIWGTTANGIKTTGRDPIVRPRTVLYDPALTLDLPPSVAGPSGLNALAHSVEALYAHDASPIVWLWAEESIRTIGRSLRKVVDAPADLEARAEVLYGAWLAALCLDSASLALHHKLCHALGGAFDLPHAMLHALVLPYALAYNAPAAPGAMRRIARALDESDPIAAIRALSLATGGPKSLAALGVAREALAAVAGQAVTTPYPNPRPLERDAVLDLLYAMFDGREPG
jgi:maleylacetate reductase